MFEDSKNDIDNSPLYEKILLIDESKNFHRTLKPLLKYFGYQLYSIHNPEDIVTQKEDIHKYFYDIIILEAEYRNHDFRQVVEFLNSDDKLKNVPKIIVTPFGINEKEYSPDQTFVGISYKPIVILDLLNTIKRAISKINIIAVSPETSDITKRIQSLSLDSYNFKYAHQEMNSLVQITKNRFKMVIFNKCGNMSTLFYAAWIRQNEAYKTTPILPIVTEKPEAELLEKFKVLDIQDFLCIDDIENSLPKLIEQFVYNTDLAILSKEGVKEKIFEEIGEIDDLGNMVNLEKLPIKRHDETIEQTPQKQVVQETSIDMDDEIDGLLDEFKDLL